MHDAQRWQMFKQFTANAAPGTNDEVAFNVPYDSIVSITVENTKSGMIFTLNKKEDVQTAVSGLNPLYKIPTDIGGVKPPIRVWLSRGDYVLLIPGNSAQGTTSVKIHGVESDDRSVCDVMRLEDCNAPINTAADTTSAADGDITVAANYIYKIMSMRLNNDTQASDKSLKLYSQVTTDAPEVMYQASSAAPAVYAFPRPPILIPGDKLRMTLGTINIGVDTVSRKVLLQRWSITT